MFRGEVLGEVRGVREKSAKVVGDVGRFVEVDGGAVSSADEVEREGFWALGEGFPHVLEIGIMVVVRLDRRGAAFVGWPRRLVALALGPRFVPV